MKVRLATAALMLLAPASAVAHGKGCNTRSCDVRVAHKTAAKKKRAAARPYRAWLDRVGWCESGVHGYTANTGNGFLGRYQFTVRSWLAVGGRGLPHQAEPLEQDYRAVRLLHLQGPVAWPVCSRRA